VRKKLTPNRRNDISAALSESQRASRLPPFIAKKAPVPVKTIATAKQALSAPLKAAPAAKKAPAPAKADAAKKVAPAVKRTTAPAKRAVAVKAAPQVTITLKQIAAELAEGHDLSKKITETVLSNLLTLVTQRLKQGAKIRLTGLGILQVRSREARMGRNPATGESIQIAASKKIAFRPAKELKEAV
jgi:DNA-binding protein HU-beta